MPAPLDKLKNFNQIVPFWKQIYYKWRSVKGVPFRKKYFIGYDLDGNTYWEFYLEKRKEVRPRRIFEPLRPQALIFDYFSMIPIQWVQWLKHTRHIAPTLPELIQDQQRVEKLQTLAKFRDEEQQYNKAVSDNKIMNNMFKELNKIEDKKKPQSHQQASIRTNTTPKQTDNDKPSSSPFNTQSDEPIPAKVKPFKRG